MALEMARNPGRGGKWRTFCSGRGELESQGRPDGGIAVKHEKTRRSGSFRAVPLLEGERNGGAWYPEVPAV